MTEIFIPLALHVAGHRFLVHSLIVIAESSAGQVVSFGKSSTLG
jgi:hypothetical protein